MDPAVVDQLHKMNIALWIMALSMGVVALAVAVAALGAFLAVRKMTGKANQAIGSITGTVEDVNGRLQSAIASVEGRARRFGAVVDVVQTEAEELLLDAASTARGVHAAAEMLRSGGQEGRVAGGQDED
ncbi:MAG TPA: hypothetical protein VM100_09950 [Longimicrobiales bacterium]|nr:hypothetical protein [Longimicrobiales bacterium]